MFARHRDNTLPFVLKVVRLRRLLEHTRRLMDLVDDGHEKHDGEYIFDRQYIVALVDGVMDELGRVLYHGAVMRPDRVGRCYALHDALRAGARTLISAGTEPAADQDATGDDSVLNSPEFRLLAKALAWMETPPDSRGMSPLDLMFDVVDASIASLRDTPLDGVATGTWHVVKSGVRHRLVRVDLETLGLPDATEAGTPAGAGCAPLRLLLLGAESGGPAATTAAECSSDWTVATSGNQVSLFGDARGGAVHVEAALTGHPPSDFLLVHASSRELEMPAAMKRRSTPNGVVHWLYDVDRAQLDAVVRDVGHILLGAQP